MFEFFRRNYKWVEEKGVYTLEIFKDHEGMAPHKLIIVTANPATLKTITDEQRKQMWFPYCSGPLEQTLIDGELSIDKEHDMDGYLPAFQAYFLNSEFKYASKHWPGLGDIRSIAQDYHTPDDFKLGIKEYFRLKNYNEFTRFFLKSNLPEQQRQAIRPLLLE